MKLIKSINDAITVESGSKILFFNKLESDELQFISESLGEKLVALLYERETPLSEQLRQKALRLGIVTLEVSKDRADAAQVKDLIGEDGIALFLPSNSCDGLTLMNSCETLCELGLPICPVVANIETSLSYNTAGRLKAQKRGFILAGQKVNVEGVPSIKVVDELLKNQDEMTVKIVDAFALRTKNEFFEITLPINLN